MSFVDEITLADLETDPYPIYARLRREAPVAWVPAAGVWFVTRFAECAEIGAGAYGFEGALNHPTLQRVFGEPNVLTTSGPTHEDLRAGIDPTLAPASVQAYVDDLVRPVAREYLARLAGTDRSELMGNYFEPVSVEALRRVMGLDGLVDATTLRRWFADLNRGVANFGLEPDAFAVADSASAEIEDVVRPLLDRLRRRRDESMLSHMLWAGRDDEPRAVETILPSLKVILLGGMQEPGHAAGSTLLGLFGEPDQFARVLADPDEWVAPAVHEGLRWIAPIGAVEREATVSCTVAGVEIAAGATVEVVLGSANRDEERFDDPDRFDLDRSSRTHQAFGNGEHFCAGHFFARQCEHIMLEELLTALPGLTADPEIAPTVTGWVFRAPKSLPVHWSAIERRERVDVAALARPAGTVELVVDAVTAIGDGIVSVVLRDPAGGEVPQWQAGAHIDLWTSADRVRQYSLCGAVDDRTSYRIAVLRDDDGRGGSRYVHDELRAGMRLPVGRPRNHFPLTDDAGHYVFVAGGIGITPILAMIADLERRERTWQLVYCGRDRARMAFLDELAVYGERVQVHESNRSGRLEVEAVLAAVAPDTVVYSCGPVALMEAVRQAADTHGLRLHVEHFHGQAGPDPSADEPFEIVIERTNESLAVPADASALDVLLANGMQVSNSCREGTCGSCEVRVVDGEIDHRDVLLTPAQRARNDRMMVCVSRAHSARIVLDV